MVLSILEWSDAVSPVREFFSCASFLISLGFRESLRNPIVGSSPPYSLGAYPCVWGGGSTGGLLKAKEIEVYAGSLNLPNVLGLINGRLPWRVEQMSIRSGGSDLQLAWEWEYGILCVFISLIAGV